ncbi:DegT/DnrJ/EryC1/StrS family aminotransferase, partial [Chloroflexota bacterium]
KLRYLDEWIAQRQRMANAYSRFFGEYEGVEVPYIVPYGSHVFNYYTVRLKNPQWNRDKLRSYLNTQGIATAIYYPLSLHLQEVYQVLGYKTGDFPESEKAQKEVLSLPIYPELQDERIARIVYEIGNYLTGRIP